MRSSPVQTHPSANGAAPLTVGWWSGEPGLASFEPLTAQAVLHSLRHPSGILYDPESRRMGHARGGAISDAPATTTAASFPLVAMLGPLYPEWLGDRGFVEAHGLRFAYMGGSMARGIATTDMVVALAEVGALGMFGAAGLPVAEVRAAIGRMRDALEARGLSWGCNLIHSPNEPRLEEELVELYLAEGVRRVEASAFMRLTPPVVRYACSGLREGPGGEVVRERHLFAKVSREEVARSFLSPAPEAMLARLVAEGKLSPEEAELGARVPVAESLIVEADSGGHTDNRPLGSLFPVVAGLRDELCRHFGFVRPVQVGAAGGLGTPAALAAAYAMGAAFVVLGSVHQAAVESGISDDGRELLSRAGPADVAMTASADMFEMGVRVQVLTRGTLMAARGNQLLDLYRRHGSLEELSADVRAGLEKSVFRMSIEEVWSRTRDFLQRTDGRQIERAERDPKHRMALVFRWYLGSSSRWPVEGDVERRTDYQLWCGPAMGAFNRWAAGSFLEAPRGRAVQQIALNLMEGAAAVTRAHQYRSYGLPVTPAAFRYEPQPLRLV